MGDGRVLSKGQLCRMSWKRPLGTSSGWAWRLYVFRFSSKCDWELLGGFEQGTVMIKIFFFFLKDFTGFCVENNL